MKIAIGCDHAALDRKLELIKAFPEHQFQDFGAHTPQSMDYPDVAFPLCEAVARGEFERGILICGTGVGMSMAANKVEGIRCALCSEGFSARLTREHNNANVLAMGARTIGSEVAFEIVRIFLDTPYQGGRHQGRIDKIHAYHMKNL